jgi:hypothetical protein
MDDLLNINPTLDTALKATTSEADFLQDIAQDSPMSANVIANNQNNTAATDPENIEPINPAPLPDNDTPPDPEKLSIEDQKKALDGVNRFLFLRKTVVSLLFAFWLQDISKMKIFGTTTAEDETLYNIYKEYAHLFGGTPKYLDLLMVEAMILIPKFTLAIKLKKETTQPLITQENNFKNNVVPMANYDRKNFFEVDEKGFYVKDVSGTYIKKENRTEKANTDVHYTELVTKNGTEKIKQIFDV